MLCNAMRRVRPKLRLMGMTIEFMIIRLKYVDVCDSVDSRLETEHCPGARLAPRLLFVLFRGHRFIIVIFGFVNPFAHR